MGSEVARLIISLRSADLPVWNTYDVPRGEVWYFSTGFFKGSFEGSTI